MQLLKNFTKITNKKLIQMLIDTMIVHNNLLKTSN